MLNVHPYKILMAAAVSAALVGATGCNDLPGTHGQQGAAIGGVGGAATGAIVGGSHHRLLGALLGGALGAGGGYLIGANSDRITGHDQAGAQAAVRRAQEHPATPEQAKSAPTADLNGDGFVTMDEVVAMKRAGFSDQQILDKMRATGQVFELSPDQQNYLRSNGVDQYVIDQIPQINGGVRDRLLGQSGAPVNPAPQAVPPPTGAPAAPPPPVYPGPSTPVPPPPSQ